MVSEYNYIVENLKNVLNKYRYEHVLRVVNTALELNNSLKLGLDENKIKYAAILHDCAKNVEEYYFEKLKDKYNLNKDVIFKDPKIAHAILGVYVAKDIYGVDDKEILGAIRWHTTGKENMSTLEKLIYISDLIEPGRDFKEDIKTIREALNKDFDNGILVGMDLNIKYLINKHVIIDLESIKARNYLQRSLND